MPQLSELQIAFVSEEIKQRGVQLQGLHEDLLDHICTAIEARMEQNESFESAFDKTIVLFGPGGLMQVQEQTLFLNTQMNETMKKFSVGFGLVATALLLAGMLFKIMHWPGAGVLLISGNFLLMALYMPFLLIHKLRESSSKEHPIIWTGFIGLVLFALGATFKVMHWPGANVMLWGGFLSLGLVFLPLYFFHRYKSSANKSITLTTAMLVLIAVLQVGLLLNLKNSTYHRHASTVVNEALEESVRYQAPPPALMQAVNSDEVAMALATEAQRIIDDLEATKLSIKAAAAEQPISNVENVKLTYLEGLDDFKAASDMLVGTSEDPARGENSAFQIKSDIDRFREQLLASYTPEDRALADQMTGLRTDLMYEGIHGEAVDWVMYHFKVVHTGGAVTMLSKLQNDIRQACNQVLWYRKNQSEPARPPSV